MSGASWSEQPAASGPEGRYNGGMSEKPAHPQRRRWQYSVRDGAWLIVMIALIMAWYAATMLR